MHSRSTTIIFSFNHGTLFLHGNQLLKAFSQKQISLLQKIHDNNDTLLIPIRLLFIHEIHGGMDKTEFPNSENNFYNFRINLKKSGFFINLGRFELEIHPYLPKQFEF
jgi:hypothetical protein